MTSVDYLGAMRRAMLRSMALAGRASTSKGGGSQRKRTRLVVDLPGSWSAAQLADALADGRSLRAESGSGEATGS